MLAVETTDREEILAALDLLSAEPAGRRGTAWRNYVDLVLDQLIALGNTD